MNNTREEQRTAARPHRRLVTTPQASRPNGIGGPAMLQLQRLAGNRAVTALAGSASSAPVQRLAGRSAPPPPTPPRRPPPSAHPGFRAAKQQVAAARTRAAAHPSAGSLAAAAGRAAKAPADDKEAQAKTAKAGDMAAAPAGTFDKAGFVAAVRAAIAKQAPKNLDEADKFAKSGKSDAIAFEVKGRASAGKDASARPMETASSKPPDTASAKEKPVVPLAGPPAVGAPATIDAASAMPAKAPPEQTDLRSGPAETDNQMAEAGVTEEQLASSNEPEFTGALAAKKEGEQHSATAPAEFRAAEAATLASARQGAQAAGTQTAAGLTAVRGPALQQSAGQQQAAQSKDEQNRAKVSSGIKAIFDATKTDVDAILNGLDGLVDKQFTAGEAAAKAAFTAYHETEMTRFKARRYSGQLGWTRWAADLFLDLPPEANKIFVEARAVYEKRMNLVIDQIADTIGRELNRAKERIAKGRKEIQAYVTGLDPSLRAIGKDAAQQIGSQFDQLDESVNEKSQALAEDLAEKYVEAGKAIDEQIVALQEANKGLISKAKDAVGGAIETILKLKDMLLGVLARAAGAVEKIIKDPIGFLGNFVNAVKTGVMNFGSNILSHLKKGLQAWLFGALAEAGVEIPEKFDLKGIVGLIMSLLGLTWASIRARLAKVLPEWVLTAVEKAVAVVQILATEGVGGLWKWIVEKITDLKEQVMSQIKDFVITKIITAGITWLISLLNPAAAFIKACKMIYDAVMWFVDNAQRLGDFVNSVLDSVEAVAAGGVGKVAALIENTLAKALPMVISGLASLLGLGGISDKIKKILQTIQKPVAKVVDGIIKGVVKYGKKLLGKLKRKKGGDSEQSKSVKKEARERVRLIGEDAKDEADLRRRIAQVETALKPIGLKALRLAVHPNGRGQILVTASPTSKAADVEFARDKSARVSVEAKVTFDTEPRIKERFGRVAAKDSQGRVILEDGKPVMVDNSLPATIASASGYRHSGSTVGGVIMPPTAKKTELVLRTWNTGDPQRMSNASHAERQMARWIEDDAPNSATIIGIDIKIKGLCPCPNCASMLVALAKVLKSRASARNKELRLSIDVSATSLYKKGWENVSSAVAALAPWHVEGEPHDSKIKVK